MPIFSELPPLSLYVHIPWCVRKCPYCDFNSHEAKSALPETVYVDALLNDLDHQLAHIQQRPIQSIFFGGGTPSLFSAAAIERILLGIAERTALHEQIEITLEANPGTIDQIRFRDFRQAGINRLSLGIQSLQDDKLKALGRIHDSDTAKRAILLAKESGFTNFNIDIMYGLPNQSIEEAIQDIETALSFQPTHFSWYQLTIEPNTLFYKQPPTLPVDDLLWEMQQSGQHILKKAGFHQYEVSAYSTPQLECVHNLNYWAFGDYLGVGAGAHSKITNQERGTVTRYSHVKNPRDYLDAAKRKTPHTMLVSETDLIFEFMLNALRLTNGVPRTLFSERTGMPIERIQPLLTTAQQRGLLIDDSIHICATELGKKLLNDLISVFLDL